MTTPLTFFALFSSLLILPVSAQTHVLPARLGHLTLVREVEGGEAQSFLNWLHSKEIAPVTSSVGEYKSGTQSATLYVSAYDSPKAARKASDKMNRLIRSGNRVFSHYAQFRQRGLTVSRCSGLGQSHFFYLYRDRVLWLSVDAQAAIGALRDLIHHTLGDVNKD